VSLPASCNAYTDQHQLIIIPSYRWLKVTQRRKRQKDDIRYELVDHNPLSKAGVMVPQMKKIRDSSVDSVKRQKVGNNQAYMSVRKTF